MSRKTAIYLAHLRRDQQLQSYAWENIIAVNSDHAEREATAWAHSQFAKDGGVNHDTSLFLSLDGICHLVRKFDRTTNLVDLSWGHVPLEHDLRLAAG